MKFSVLFTNFVMAGIILIIIDNKNILLVEMKNHPWFTSDFESFGHLLEEEEERVSFKLGQSDSE